MIIVAGLNHRRAPVELRERLAVPPEALPAMLAEAKAALGAAEVVLLSTCNRVELYHVGGGDAAAFLAKKHGIPATILYRHEGHEATRHLFRVAAGFDSMVPGETQILGQTKDAYHAARDAGHTGRVLNRVFQTAFHVAKKAHAEMTLGDKSVSVPSVATRLAGKVFTDLGSKTLVVIGAGETGRLTVEAFREKGVRNVIVVNRTVERAERLGEAHGLDELPAVLPRADILISCITHDGYVLAPEHVQAALKTRRREPMFLIDIAVPRNIHPDANRLDNVYLFDIDDLQEIVHQNLRERERVIEAHEPEIERAAQEAMRDLEAFDVTRVLAQMRETFHQVGDEEAAKALAKLDPAQREEVRIAIDRILNRILHAPTTALKEEARNGESFRLVELAVRLFGLKRQA